MLLTALILFGGFKTYRLGQGEAEARWSVKYRTLVTDTEKASAVETARQALAARLARQKLDLTVSRYEEEAQAREATIKELSDEAIADRDAGRMCLNADSVRRIGKATASRSN